MRAFDYSFSIVFEAVHKHSVGAGHFWTTPKEALYTGSVFSRSTFVGLLDDVYRERALK